MEIIDDIHRIDEASSNIAHANVYLVINEKEIMVIDTGTVGNAKKIVAYIQKISHQPSLVSTIRIAVECDAADCNHVQNQKTGVFFSYRQIRLAVALVIKNLDSCDKLDCCLDRWGSHLKYIQVMNEPEASSTW